MKKRRILKGVLRQATAVFFALALVVSGMTPMTAPMVVKAETTSETVYSNDFSSWSIAEWTVAGNDSSDTVEAKWNNDTDQEPVWVIYSPTEKTITATQTITSATAGDYVVLVDTAGEKASGTIAISDGTNTKSVALATGWDGFTTVQTEKLTVAEGATLTMTVTAQLSAEGSF